MASTLEVLNLASIQFRNNPPEFLAIQTATSTSMTSGTSWLSLNFADSAGILVDNYSGHSTSVNNTRYTIQVAGTYTIGGSVTFQANTTGLRGARLAKNGSAIPGLASMMATPTSTAISTGITLPTRNLTGLVVGDYLELQGLQNSGSTLTTYIGADIVTMLWIRWDHP